MNQPDDLIAHTGRYQSRFRTGPCAPDTSRRPHNMLRVATPCCLARVMKIFRWRSAVCWPLRLPAGMHNPACRRTTSHRRVWPGVIGSTRHRLLAHRLTFEPVTAAPAHLEPLKQAGWSLRGIVTLAQLVAFVSFQSRLLAGLRSLQGDEASGEVAPVVAGHWHEALHTASGKTALTAFTQTGTRLGALAAGKTAVGIQRGRAGDTGKIRSHPLRLFSPAGAQSAVAGAAHPDR
ncbi:Uncharacterized protein conserved in bacteria [Pantoea agglomerans]|uniref:Uncharacterized protein conserved in bacteria n=1 Tax=Enterobacter agglomerans TaxID=549 RepID=A0A379LQI7_ENTAG|nr:Uncharacterized protein conserved in bacteria [Pantoea agglomerans]